MRPRRTLAEIILRGWRGGVRIGPVPATVKPGDRIRIDGKDAWRVVRVRRLPGRVAEHEVVCERDNEEPDAPDTASVR